MDAWAFLRAGENEAKMRLIPWGPQSLPARLLTVHHLLGFCELPQDPLSKPLF